MPAFALGLLAVLALADPALAQATAAAAPRPESFLQWMIRASGVIGLVLLAMSFYLVAVVAWMFRRFRLDRLAPEPLAEELTDLLEHKQYDRAYARLASDGSMLALVLGAAVRKLPSGSAAATRALEMAVEDHTMAMEHRTTYLATVGTLGPMIGLIGTVYGMIRSFQAIATMGASPQASALAAGISTSLFATLEGICVSVPAIAFYAYFRNRIARLSLAVQARAESLLEPFSAGVRSIHPLAAAVAPTHANPAPNRPALPPRDS
jgi:biopolymer transport protein ExbB